MLKDYIKSVEAELIDDEYIDVAIVVDTEIFTYFGVNNKKDDFGNIHNEFGYFDVIDLNGYTWFWAITNKKPNSRIKNKVGDFYLTDTETGKRIDCKSDKLKEFKKMITPMLDKEIERFYKEDCKYYV